MTNRIEAIRARHESGHWTPASLLREHVEVLLAEYRRARFHEQNNFTNWKEAEAQVRRVTALAANWERLAGTAMDPEVREWLTAVSSSLRAALAPVAPDAEPGHPNDSPAEDDAEPGEWEWSPGDVAQGGDTVCERSADGTYPWRCIEGGDQRDQDITALVTDHGGRVLVCKARGIGVGGAS